MAKSKHNKRKRGTDEHGTTSAKKLLHSGTEVVGPCSGGFKDKENTGRVSQLPMSSQLPLAAQYDLLRYVQHLLEDTCQRYGKQWCPEEMEKRGWIQPRSLELQCWVRFIKSHSNLLPPSAPPLRPAPSEEHLFAKVVQIRNLGVHRQVLELPTILQHLHAAREFAALHQDAQVASQMSSIIDDVQEVVDRLSTQQGELKKNLQSQLQELRVQQAAREKQVRMDTDKMNGQYLVEAGTKVETLLCDWLEGKTVRSDRDDASLYDSSDIDEILMEASRTMQRTQP